MANDTIGDSNTLQFDIPQKGNKDWSQVIKDAFKKIAAHDHSEGGNGAKIGETGLDDNAVTSVKIKALNVTTAKIADANVTLAKVENVSDANIIVGNGSNRPTAVAVSGDVSLSNTGAVTIGNNAITTDKINDSEITVAKKKTYEVTLTDASTYYALADLTSLAGANNKSFKINYKISDSSNNIQVGSISGVTGVSKVDEYVGVDMGADLQWNGSTTYQLEVKPGTAGDVLTYSIEFLE